MISLIKNALILTVNQQNEVLKNSNIVIAGWCIQTIGGTYRQIFRLTK